MHYAVTAKKTRSPITVSHYHDYLNYLSDYGEVANVYFEQTRGIHIHFVFKPYKVITKFIMYPSRVGWNIHWTPVYDYGRWDKYCRKDTTVEDNIEPNSTSRLMYKNIPVSKMPKLFSKRIIINEKTNVDKEETCKENCKFDTYCPEDSK